MPQRSNLSLSVGLDDIQSEPRSYTVEATEEERDGLAERFKVVSIDKLQADITVGKVTNPKAISVAGDLSADLIQQCIVTLKNVPEKVQEHFELLLVSPELAAEFDEDEVYADPEAPDYDSFDDDVIPVGEIVAQTLSVMMNPYPRVPGAEIQPVAGQAVSVNEEVGKKPNPFDVLSKLRDKS